MTPEQIAKGHPAMTNLSERVMSLSGPDREVDAEIMFDLYARPCGVSKIDGGPRGYLWPEDNPSWNFGLRFPGRNREWFEEQRTRGDGERLLIERDGALVLMNNLRIPLLTASIDAAMTLVPEGWCVWQMGEVPDNSPINWHVTLWQDGAINPGDCSHAATPALALCAAALIAREASNAE